MVYFIFSYIYHIFMVNVAKNKIYHTWILWVYIHGNFTHGPRDCFELCFTRHQMRVKNSSIMPIGSVESRWLRVQHWSPWTDLDRVDESMDE